MKTNILNKLKHTPEMNPDEHDGSYELMRATVNAYRSVDEALLDYLDLNTVYLMAVGTFKHGVPVKKKTIESSHLPQESKLALIELLDKIQARAKDGKYEYEGKTEPGAFGMFGTGFYSFKNRTDNESVSSFIKMCIDISEMTDDNEMFLRAEPVLTKKFKGMGAAAASVVLHCLKPNTFPVLNSNQSYKSIFEALDIPLTRKGNIDTYIQNCRAIKAFRDANLSFKNYRIIDLAARELGEKENPIAEIIRQYKEDFVDRDKQEGYKWKAIKCFQDNWNIDAEDFAGMLNRALYKSDNLLDKRNIFPKAMIVELAEKEPNTVRDMFRNIYDENVEITERVEAFISSAKDLFTRNRDLNNEKMKSHYQDQKVVGIYLFFRYPEKYFLYQFGKFKGFAAIIGYDAQIKQDDVQNIPAYYEMCEMVLAEVKKDKELQALSKGRLDFDRYQDPEFHMLTEDIISFGNKFKNQLIVDDGDSEQDSAAEEGKSKMHELDKNLILYGPPGTGKTYSAVLYAVAIIEEKPVEEIRREDYAAVFSRYQQHREDGLVEFTTFHQSYGYEEFIEGIRPVVTSEEEGESRGEIRYEIRDGLFKVFCDKAGSPVGSAKDIDLGIGKSPTVWKVSLGGTGDNPVRSECLQNGHIRIGWDKYGEVLAEETDYSKDGGRVVLNAFYNNMQIGDLVLSCFSSRTIDAIGVVTGEPEWDDEYPVYKRLRKVKWLAKGISEDIVDLNAGRIMTLSTVYKLSITVTDTLDILRRINPSLFSSRLKVPNRVFIIDEINRGNISKIFGELITLIEPTKRLGAKESQRSALPYSGHKFGIPDNVYIIGTMNTADRSIALIDTALRRRFGFIEMQPDPTTLAGTVVENIDIAVLLETMNKRITVLHDREHTVGHSYLLPLKDDPSIENLARIFKNKIVPLLQEYFYDDYEKIRMVLGDNRKTQELQFIIKKNDVQALFGNSEMDLDDYFEINDEAFIKVEAYAFLQ